MLHIINIQASLYHYRQPGNEPHRNTCRVPTKMGLTGSAHQVYGHPNVFADVLSIDFKSIPRIGQTLLINSRFVNPNKPEQIKISFMENLDADVTYRYIPIRNGTEEDVQKADYIVRDRLRDGHCYGFPYAGLTGLPMSITPVGRNRRPNVDWNCSKIGLLPVVLDFYSPDPKGPTRREWGPPMLAEVVGGHMDYPSITELMERYHAE